jgi:heterodisulfide reductase subunit A
MSRRVVIIGGGVAGMQASIALADLGIPSVLVEKEADLGGRVKNYDKLFPFFRSAKDLTGELISRVHAAPSTIDVRCEALVGGVEGQAPHFAVKLAPGREIIEAGAIVVAAGFEPFEAALQEEYGYGVYKNVVTATELEHLLDPQGPTGGELRRPSDGQVAKSLAIVFCVGSRSEKVGHNYCSRICCSFSTKQAIEVKEKYPDAVVDCFYMDVRTYGRGFEEMYRRAQELGVTYIRGRVAECGQLPNGDITIRAEDTFLGRPVRGVFNLVSLSHGMTPCVDSGRLAELLGIALDQEGFFDRRDGELNPYESTREGIFLAGAVTGLKPVTDCLADGIGVAARVAGYLTKMHSEAG